ncbi:hypothetical protein AURDEDRAFT_184219 [Auricularia subglabra TFB-10046 SS5]|nr:hypothetical protein AURDEDRAFT_184219 [Auricularia subglabra TFB-10046 SS5]
MTINAAAAIQGVYWIQFRSYEHIGLYALFVYEWLLCFSQEWTYLSTSGFSFAKAAYLTSRYWPLLTHPVKIWTSIGQNVSPAACERSYRIVLALQVGNFLGTSATIIIRVHAFSGRERTITYTLCACMLCVVAYQLWVAVERAAFVTGPVCYPIDSGKGKFVAGYVAAPLAWDCVAFILTVANAVQSGTLSTIVMNSSLCARIFLRDGIAYFVAIVAIHAFNTVMSFQSKTARGGIGMPLTLLLPNLLACRLLLHLRNAGKEETQQTDCVSTCIEFAKSSLVPGQEP